MLFAVMLGTTVTHKFPESPKSRTACGPVDEPVDDSVDGPGDRPGDEKQAKFHYYWAS